MESKTNNQGYGCYACANHPSYVALDYIDSLDYIQ